MNFPRPHVRVLARLAIAAAPFLVAGPALALNGSCEFRTVGTITLPFGNINPSASTNVVASITPGQMAEIGRCKDVTMSVTADQGQNFSGGRRMARAGGGFIAYSLTLPAGQAAPGNGQYVPLVITGIIAPAAYQNAVAGFYSDSVVITVSP